MTITRHTAMCIWWRLCQKSFRCRTCKPYERWQQKQHLTNAGSETTSSSKAVRKERSKHGSGREKDQSSVSACVSQCEYKRGYILSCLTASLDTPSPFTALRACQHSSVRVLDDLSFPASFSAADDCWLVDKTLGK